MNMKQAQVSPTPRQQELLYFIEDYVAQNDLFPTFEEMREGMNMSSKSEVHRLVTGLEERGHIVRLPHKARAGVLLKEVK